MSDCQIITQKKLVSQPVPQLPSWCVWATTLSMYGYYDEVLDLLQHMSKATRAYARSHHLSTLRGILLVSKWLPRSFGLPNKLTSNRVKRTKRIKALKRSGSCNDVRDYLLRAWERPKVQNFEYLCRVIVDTYCDTRKIITQTVIGMLIHHRDYQFNPLVQSESIRYFEYSVNEEFLFIFLFAGGRNESTDEQAEGIRMIITGQRDVARWVEHPYPDTDPKSVDNRPTCKEKLLSFHTLLRI